MYLVQFKLINNYAFDGQYKPFYNMSMWFFCYLRLFSSIGFDTNPVSQCILIGMFEVSNLFKLINVVVQMNKITKTMLMFEWLKQRQSPLAIHFKANTVSIDYNIEQMYDHVTQGACQFFDNKYLTFL